jgi:hypothetical protein
VEPVVDKTDADLLAAAGIDGATAEKSAVSVATEVMDFLTRDLSEYVFNHVAACLQHEEVWRQLRLLLAQRLEAKRS